MDRNKFTEFHIVSLPACASTNTYIKERVNELSENTVVIADIQTDGRGRLGNKWVADKGALSMSVLFRNIPSAQNMTIISAVAVCQSLYQLYGIKAGIKWTNDVICENKKICGILCESAIKCSSDVNTDQSYVICGIGLNVNQGSEFFEENGLSDGASLCSLYGREFDKLEIGLYILRKTAVLQGMAFSEVIMMYRELCVTLGKSVKLVQNNCEITAYAKDIDENGRLICENESGEFVVNSGVVRVRGINGEYV
ncbi:MAG: biotin--[acetyl-CoA-carboxylase] ligase [Ruminiclostridium sp.]|nr:biotin--[acetyl-CoA-carboxylase] ligase [Ruminiclostridium sp.]